MNSDDSSLLQFMQTADVLFFYTAVFGMELYCQSLAIILKDVSFYISGIPCIFTTWTENGELYF